MSNLFSIRGGFYFPVYQRKLGWQDKGFSPEGAQDQLSFKTAYYLFNKPSSFQAIEMLYSGKVVAEQDILFVLCGASYSDTTLDGENISYNQIFSMSKGQVLEFTGVKKGFRTLIFAVEKAIDSAGLIGKKRSQELEKLVTDIYKSSFIRVMKGPEYSILKDEKFFNAVWNISSNSSQMGLVLDGPKLEVEKIEMISQPVVDGTVQLSPGGPIVLMRYRQTVGGYPRIANVAEIDISKLSQLSPNSKVRFKLIEFNEAVRELDRLRALLDANIS